MNAPDRYERFVAQEGVPKVRGATVSLSIVISILAVPWIAYLGI